MYIPQQADNTSLYNATISSTGPITGIDTTGFNSLVAQFAGSWQGIVIFEASHDEINWQTIPTTDMDVLTISDEVTNNGFVGIRISGMYIRANVTKLISGSITLIILGKTSTIRDATESLTWAMDKAQNAPMYVQTLTGDPKVDINNAAVPSDAPQPIRINWYNDGVAGTGHGFPVIDTQGYQSLSIQFNPALAINLTAQFSDDGGNSWGSVLAYLSTNASTAGNINSPGAGSIYLVPCWGRLFRLANSSTNAPTTVSAYVYLRQQPLTNTQTNLAFIGSTAPVSVGAAGIVPIAGVSPVGSTNSTYPVQIASADTSGFTRKVLSDASGRLFTNLNGLDPSGTSRQIGALSGITNNLGVPALVTNDVSNENGGTTIAQFLNQILAELKVITFQLTEFTNTTMQNVEDIRNEALNTTL